MKKSAIIISASSDIGSALCDAWHEKGWKIAGTYRNLSTKVQELKGNGMDLFSCDLLDENSLLAASQNLVTASPDWDVLVFASGTLQPIGSFEKVDFSIWERGIEVNFLRPLQILHRLLPYRNKKSQPTVLFFAGGGVNGAVSAYSSYTVSKISLIKICELLDEEIPDTRFVIIGPGWVKTKIHNATLSAEHLAEGNFQRTLDKFQSGDWVPMQRVVDCFTYLATTACDGVSGRNFSVGSDSWGTEELEQALVENKDMYKLRRHDNDWKKDIVV